MNTSCTPARLRRALLALCIALSFGIAGCAERDDSVKAATQLAEALYPGELEFFASSFQKDHYIVTFAVRSDSVTRIDLRVDSDSAKCRVGTPCEDRLRKAYAEGLENGRVLKALTHSFRSCGVPLLAVTGLGLGPAYFHPQIELNLTTQNQQKELDRLSPCLESFRQASAAAKFNVAENVIFHIFPTVSAKPTLPPDPLTREHHVERKRYENVTYFARWHKDSNFVGADSLRLYPHFGDSGGLDKKLAKIATEFLKPHPESPYVPKVAFARNTKLDTQRIDLIRAYILACSQFKSDQGPCKTDIGVEITYDLTADKATEVSLVSSIRDERGNLVLPELPGR